MSNLDNLNPIISKNQNIQDMSKLVYEPLLRVTEDFKIEGALAEEWSKAEDKVYLIKLREGVKWHNGNNLIAADVKFTVDTIKSLGNEYVYFANVSNIENVDIISDTILRIYLYEEEPFFEYNLTFPIISLSYFSGEDIKISEKNNIPMGTGMYKIKSVDMNSQIQLVTNDNWWNSQNIKPKLNEINIKVYSSVAEVYNAYKLGSIDLLNTTLSNIEENIGTIGYSTKETCGREFDYLALNCGSDMLKNKEVRQAVSYAINKKDIINNIFGGKYIEADYPLGYGSYLYNKDISNYEYNVDKAKQILQNNGWTYSNKYWQKKIDYRNVRLKIDLLVNSSNETRVKVANMIKEDIEEIRNRGKC